MFPYGLVAGPHSLIDTIIVASRYVKTVVPTILNVITGRIYTNEIGSTKYEYMKTLKPYINFETLHIYWAKDKKIKKYALKTQSFLWKEWILYSKKDSKKLVSPYTLKTQSLSSAIYENFETLHKLWNPTYLVEPIPFVQIRPVMTLNIVGTTIFTYLDATIIVSTRLWGPATSP